MDGLLLMLLLSLLMLLLLLLLLLFAIVIQVSQLCCYFLTFIEMSPSKFLSCRLLFQMQETSSLASACNTRDDLSLLVRRFNARLSSRRKRSGHGSTSQQQQDVSSPVAEVGTLGGQMARRGGGGGEDTMTAAGMVGGKKVLLEKCPFYYSLRVFKGVHLFDGKYCNAKINTFIQHLFEEVS